MEKLVGTVLQNIGTGIFILLFQDQIVENPFEVLEIFLLTVIVWSVLKKEK